MVENHALCGTTGGKGSCGKEDVTYSITCNNCGKRDIVRLYHGETSKNAYTCGKKHLEDLDRKIDALDNDIVNWIIIVNFKISLCQSLDCIEMIVY